MNIRIVPQVKQIGLCLCQMFCLTPCLCPCLMLCLALDHHDHDCLCLCPVLSLCLMVRILHCHCRHCFRTTERNLAKAFFRRRHFLLKLRHHHCRAASHFERSVSHTLRLHPHLRIRLRRSIDNDRRRFCAHILRIHKIYHRLLHPLLLHVASRRR